MEETLQQRSSERDKSSYERLLDTHSQQTNANCDPVTARDTPAFKTAKIKGWQIPRTDKRMRSDQAPQAWRTGTAILERGAEVS